MNFSISFWVIYSVAQVPLIAQWLGLLLMLLWKSYGAWVEFGPPTSKIFTLVFLCTFSLVSKWILYYPLSFIVEIKNKNVSKRG